MLPSREPRHGYYSQDYEALVRQALREAGIETPDFWMTLHIDISWTIGRPVEVCIEQILAKVAAGQTGPC
ncbi:hypothetical protein [Polymorphum gilvum]|uniref:hypothetical protein n=1 Tax=Polymorphum gilvum TaxID=991904 RepID=UPI0011D1A6B8|nr:hypothetical protein [Polymorphum gilvum]